jgi:hypothetical protein
VLLVGQEVDRQWQPTAGQYRDQTVLTQRTDETVERHGRDMMNHRAQLQTEAAVRGQQGIPGRLLLDSRVVDLSTAYHPTLVILSSLKPLFFNRLKDELRFLDNGGA